VSLLFTLGMIAFLLVALACIIAIPIALNYLPAFIGRIIDIARWPVLLVCVGAALAFIYRYGPSRTEPRWRWLGRQNRQGKLCHRRGASFAPGALTALRKAKACAVDEIAKLGQLCQIESDPSQLGERCQWIRTGRT
jgi:hypothetical protein